GRDRGPERQRFGTPPPTGAGGREQRGGGPPSGFHQPVTPPPTGGPAGEARGQRERMQGAYGQPPPPQQQPQQPGVAPASVDHDQRQGQPEGGKTRQPKETPPPGQQ
ncbi:MAG TPA: hypothetical protein VK557_20560, partial [Pyrinomonadaceae bacterium]|nr:hypothetical protein [Pyrinomonadaceae bacterium]